jgi:MIP family channel proteins
LNPAVSLALAIFRPHDFPWYKTFYYILFQLLGAIGAGAVVYGIWSPWITRFEEHHNITRGEPGSHLSAAMFGEYFPNPGISDDPELVSPVAAFLVEALGTFILCSVIFTLTDKKNSNFYTNPGLQALVPFYIGVTVAVLISVFAPVTQAGWNPARDFGPRVVAALAGWGQEAIPGPRAGFWVYILGPMVGGPLGGAFYHFVLGFKFRMEEEKIKKKERELEEAGGCDEATCESCGGTTKKECQKVAKFNICVNDGDDELLEKLIKRH